MRCLTRILGRLFLVVLASGGLGCGPTRVGDAASYPLQFQELRRFSPDVAWVSRVPGSPSAGDRILEAHIHPQSGEYFIEIASPGGEIIHQRFGIGPGPRRAKGETVEFLGCTVPRDQRVDSLRAVYSWYTPHAAGLLWFLPEAGPGDTLLRLERPAGLAAAAPWDISLFGPVRLGTENPAATPVLVSVNYGACPLPRELLFFDRPGSPSPRFRLVSGGQFLYQDAADLDGDGRREWLFASTAPCNGRVAGGLRDDRSYYLALRQDGRRLWLTETARGGGSARLFVPPGGGLIGLRAYQHFNHGGLRTAVQRLDPKSGRVLKQAMLSGEVNETRGRLLQLDVARGELAWLDLDFRRVGRPVRIEGARRVEEEWRDPTGRPLLRLRLASGLVALLDERLRVQGCLEMTLLSDEKMSLPAAGGNPAMELTPARDADGALHLLRPVIVPWWRWWTWRYRWILAALLVPLLVAAVAFVVHRIRMRLQAARLMRDFTQELLQRQEEERARIARELHDDLGQELTLTRLALLRDHPEAAHPGNLRHEMVSGLDNAMDSMRRIIDELHPPILDQLGLRAALEWLLARLSRRTGLAVRLEDDGDEPDLPEPVRLALFRIAQEALTNAAKHARATGVRVGLWDLGDRIRLSIQDDGLGVDVDAVARKGRHGWLGMAERVRPWKGRVDIASHPGDGLRVRVDIEWKAIREVKHDPRALGG